MKACTISVIVGALTLANVAAAEKEISIRGVMYTEKQARHWYSSAAKSYMIRSGKCIPFSECFDGGIYIDHKVFQVADDTHLLFNIGNRTIALAVPSTTKRIAEGDPIKCLGIRNGTYSYVSVLGGKRQVRLFDYHPRMTFQQFLRAARTGVLKAPAKPPSSKKAQGISRRAWQRSHPPRLARPVPW